MGLKSLKGSFRKSLQVRIKLDLKSNNFTSGSIPKELTKEDIAFIKGSWSSIYNGYSRGIHSNKLILHNFMNMFFDYMYTNCPESEVIKDDIPKQTKIFGHIISLIVINLEKLEGNETELIRLGKIHKKYGVKASMLPHISKAFILCFDKYCPKIEWTKEHKSSMTLGLYVLIVKLIDNMYK